MAGNLVIDSFVALLKSPQIIDLTREVNSKKSTGLGEFRRQFGGSFAKPIGLNLFSA
jgi:hypothetical protein